MKIKKLFVPVLASTTILFGSIAICANNLKDNAYSYTSSFKNNNSTKNDDVVVSNLVMPKANDLYNDYAYVNGFVDINNNVISFYNWFGFKMWTFDITDAANSILIFGSTSVSVQTLKVRSSSSDYSQIFVYGTLTDGRSFLFKLDANNGTILNFQNNTRPFSFVSDNTSNSLINNLNLLTLSDKYLILLPKTLTYDANNLKSISVTFSEIDLSSNTLTNYTFDLSQAVSTKNVYAYGEIVFALKAGTNYSFGIKWDGINNQSLYAPACFIACVNSTQPNVVYYNNNYTFRSGSKSPNDLDKVFFNVQKIEDTSTDQKLLISMNYSTASQIETQPNQNATYNGVVYINSSASGNATCNNFNTSQNEASGIVGYYNDINTKTTYEFLCNSNLSKIGISSVYSGSNDVLTNDPATWMDISSIASNTNQIVDISFIPNSSLGNNMYYGYIDVQSQNDDGTLTLSTYYFILDAINSNNISFKIVDPIQYTYSDNDISNKYNNSYLPVNQNTKNLLINDLTNVSQNGNQLTPTVDHDNLILDPYVNTIIGSLGFLVNNWWNQSQSELIRSVNLQLNDNNVNNSNTNSDSNGNRLSDLEICFIAIAVVIVLLILALLIYKYIDSRKERLYQE